MLLFFFARSLGVRQRLEEIIDFEPPQVVHFQDGEPLGEGDHPPPGGLLPLQGLHILHEVGQEGDRHKLEARNCLQVVTCGESFTSIA